MTNFLGYQVHRYLNIIIVERTLNRDYEDFSEVFNKITSNKVGNIKVIYLRGIECEYLDFAKFSINNNKGIDNNNSICLRNDLQWGKFEDGDNYGDIEEKFEIRRTRSDDHHERSRDKNVLELVFIDCKIGRIVNLKNRKIRITFESYEIKNVKMFYQVFEDIYQYNDIYMLYLSSYYPDLFYHDLEALDQICQKHNYGTRKITLVVGVKPFNFCSFKEVNNKISNISIYDLKEDFNILRPVVKRSEEEPPLRYKSNNYILVNGESILLREYIQSLLDFRQSVKISD